MGGAHAVDPLETLFRTMSLADRDTVTQTLRIRKLDQGAVLFSEGQPGTSMFIIAEGQLRARAEGKSGRTLRDMGPGEFVGEMACVDPAPRSVTVIAITDTVAYELDRPALEALRTSAPRAAAAIVNAVMHTVTNRMLELDRRVAAELGESPPAAPSPTRPSATQATEVAGNPKSRTIGRLVGWLRGSE